MLPRVLELALENLLSQKKKLEQEISEIQAELRGKRPASKIRSFRKKTAAEKKAQSEKMKAIWAKRRAGKKGR
jgi:hypothetical protein